MADRPFNVLFLCTGNSARSVLAESILNGRGKGQFVAYSAGSRPTGSVNPFAVELLKRMNLPTDGLRSKSWDEFAQPGAPPIDFIFTVCDNAAGESCPYWPGHPMTAHWGVPDPAAQQGTDAEKTEAFRNAFRILERRIMTFISLPIATLEGKRLQDKLDAIGKTDGSEA
jgi:protein-tyrosine-phosphatase